MANQKLTVEQLKAIQAAKNSQAMSLSYEQVAQANAQNGTGYGAGQQLNFDAPIIQSAHACKVVLRYNLTATIAMGAGSATLNAAAPYNFVQKLSVNFGNKQVDVHPYLSKALDMLEGYNRGVQDKSFGNVSAAVDNLLRKVPTTLVNGANVFQFDVEVPLNALHPQSVQGILPIYSSGTRMQIGVTCASSLSGADPLLHPIKVAGGAAVSSVTGSVQAFVVYRDWQSMTTRQPLEFDLTGLQTAQIIQLPSVQPLTAGTMNYQSIRNPYPFAKIISIVIDGKQSDKFSAADNITALTIEKAENSSSAFKKFGDENGGMVNYYKEIRATYGQDLEDGVLRVLDATTENIQNVSAKTGVGFLNLTNDGFPAGRIGYRVGSVDGTTITPRIVSWGVILNPDGIRA